MSLFAWEKSLNLFSLDSGKHPKLEGQEEKNIYFNQHLDMISGIGRPKEISLILDLLESLNGRLPSAWKSITYYLYSIWFHFRKLRMSLKQENDINTVNII